MKIFAKLVGVGAILSVIGVPLASVASGSGSTVTSVTPSNAVEQTVEQADNAYLAVFSPLASGSGGAMSFGTQFNGAPSSLTSYEGEFTDNLGESIGTQALEAASLASSSGNAIGLTQSGSSDWSTPAAELTYVDPASLEARNEPVIDSLFAPTLANQILTTARNINNQEVTLWKNGLSSCSAQDCTITGAAGAVVTSFNSESIGATSATVEATEIVWQDDGEISSQTGTFTWYRSEGTFTSVDQLQLTSGGQWQVSTHSLTPLGGSSS